MSTFTSPEVEETILEAAEVLNSLQTSHGHNFTFNYSKVIIQLNNILSKTETYYDKWETTIETSVDQYLESYYTRVPDPQSWSPDFHRLLMAFDGLLALKSAD